MFSDFLPSITDPNKTSPLYPSGSQTSPRSVLLQATPLPKPQSIQHCCCRKIMKINIWIETQKNGTFESNGMIGIYVHASSSIEDVCLHPSPLELSAFVVWDLFENRNPKQEKIRHSHQQNVSFVSGITLSNHRHQERFPFLDARGSMQYQPSCTTGIPGGMRSLPVIPKDLTSCWQLAVAWGAQKIVCFSYRQVSS